MRQADEAFVVTNGGFAHHMRIPAANFRMHLVDREQLRQWAGRSQPADDTALPGDGELKAGAGAFGFARSVALCGVEG